MKLSTNVAKGLNRRVRKFWRLIPTVVEVTGEKLAGRAFLPPILNRVRRFLKEKEMNVG